MNFQKSGDEKNYLTEIKNITGNVISDKELLEFGKLKETEFNKNIRKLFTDKKNSRVKILGENQNCSLEKKIFLQIIDFSWRSHLQYLEQLRQVIGLRQYGQKDPLSEFKKEERCQKHTISSICAFLHISYIYFKIFISHRKN